MGKQTIGYRYFMTLHMGIGRGPVDEIVQVKVGGVRAWPVAEKILPEGGGLLSILQAAIQAALLKGQPTDLVTIAEGPNGTGVMLLDTGESTTIDASRIMTARETNLYNIKAAAIFGGERKEGGIDGTMEVVMGQSNQDPSWRFLRKGMQGLIPAFRGVTSILFDGLVCTMNPYPKKWSFRVRRTVKGWQGDSVWRPGIATIWMKNGAIKAMNPAHIIYECLTNKAWGRGLDPAIVSDASFNAAGITLHNENFGLCLKWSRQTELDQFIKTVLDHIGGALNTDRETGLITLDLIRGDYDPNTIPHFDYESGLLEIDDDEVISQDELINEVIVEWFDPLTASKREVRAHNLALVQSMGSKTVTNTNYEGIPTADLAARVAQRDLKVSSIPLRRYKLILDRSAWRLRPASVFRISAPDRGLSNLVLRAGKVSESRFGDGKIKIEAVLDVFALPSTTYIKESESEFTAPDRSLVFPVRRQVDEATYADLYIVVDPANLAQLDEQSGWLGTLASRPTPLSQAYHLRTKTSTETEWSEGSFGQFNPSVELSVAITPTQTDVPFAGAVDIGLVKTGMMVTLGNEICRLDAITTEDGFTGTMTLARGCVDTIPIAHAALEVAYFSTVGDKGMDEREYARTEVVQVKMQTTTSSGMLPFEEAPTDSLTITARHARPYAPGNVRVNGTSIYSPPLNVTGDIAITWSRRNRETIKDKLVPHFAGESGVEAGVLYRLRVYKGETLARTETVDGNSFTYTDVMATEDDVGSTITFHLEAERSGTYSRSRYVFSVNRV